MAKRDIKAIFDLCSSLVNQISDEEKKTHKISSVLTNSLETSFNDILEFSRFYLIQAYDKFYGSILMDLDFYIDFKQKGLYDLKVNKEPFSLTVNPLWLPKKTNIMEFIGGIVNELMKLIYMHPSEYPKLNSEKDSRKHKLLDMASDASASSLVKHDIKLDKDASNPGIRIPEDVYTTSQLNHDLKCNSQESQTLNYYFKLLQKIKDNGGGNDGNQKGMYPSSSQGQGQGDDSDGNGDGDGTGGYSTPSNGQGEQTHAWEGLDSDELKDACSSLVINAWNSMDERSRGTVPSSIASQLKILMTPPDIPWQQEFKKMLGSQPCGFQLTRRKLNRRQPERPDLPGRIIDTTVNVVACFDTSGSMSDDDLKNCCNEVLNILYTQSKRGAEGFKLTVVECDATVQRVYTVKNMREFTTQTNKGMAGRGGTYFTPAIEYINGEGDYADKKKWPQAGTYKNAFMIFFTDGYGESEIPKPKTYRNMWVVLESESNLSVKEPYGDVKKLRIKH